MSERYETSVGEGFDPETKDMVGATQGAKHFVAGEVLADLADDREDICVVTGDLGLATQVYVFEGRHPERYFNFGIAEHNMVSASAGLAAVGMRPYVSGYGFFLGLIAAEQIRTDICYPKLPVRMIGTNSGISHGFLGTSHHATEDISILRSLADLTLLAPVDGVSLKKAIEVTVDHPGPIYFRMGAGGEPIVYEEAPEDWRVGGSAELRSGEDATVLATGVCVSAALGASDQLAEEGINLRVVDMYSLKPLDQEAVERAARETRRVFTAEEHNVLGGSAPAVAEVLAETGLGTPLRRIGIPDEYSLLGPPGDLYNYYGIDAEGIAQTVRHSLA